MITNNADNKRLLIPYICTMFKNIIAIFWKFSLIIKVGTFIHNHLVDIILLGRTMPRYWALGALLLGCIISAVDPESLGSKGTLCKYTWKFRKRNLRLLWSCLFRKFPKCISKWNKF